MRCLKAVALAIATSIFAPSIVAAPTNALGYSVTRIGEEIVHAADGSVDNAPRDLAATCSVTPIEYGGSKYDILVPKPVESCAKVREALKLEKTDMFGFSCKSAETGGMTHITFSSLYSGYIIVRKIDMAYGREGVLPSDLRIPQACGLPSVHMPPPCPWCEHGIEIKQNLRTMIQDDGVLFDVGIIDNEPLTTSAVNHKQDETSVLPRDAFLGGKPNGFFVGIPMLSNVAINCVAHSLRYHGLTKIRTYDTWIRALSDTHCPYTMQLLSGVPGISNIFCSGYDTHENTHITFDIPDEDILDACGAMNDAYVPGPSHANQTLDICLVMKAAWSDQWQFGEDNDG